MSQTTDQLISRLAADAAVERLPSLRVRWGVWTVAAVAMVIAAMAWSGVTPGWSPRFAQSTFVMRAVLTWAVVLLAGRSAFVLSVPGAERSVAQRGLPMAVAVAWVALLEIQFVLDGGTLAGLWHTPMHPACGQRIAEWSIGPAVVLFAMLRRAAPLDIVWSAGLASLSGAALGAAAVQVVCPVDGAAHQLVAHVLPVLALVGAGAVAGSVALRMRHG